MKVTFANFGPLTQALRASLEDLDIEVIIPKVKLDLNLSLAKNHFPSELCYPLKIILGNFLSTIDYKPDAVIFFTGCDMCNLSPINYSYIDIFNQLGWFPDCYFCEINSKKSFILSYLNVLKKLSGKSWLKVLSSLRIGIDKYEAFNLIDQVFYSVRPAISDISVLESYYNRFFNDLVHSSSCESVSKVSSDLVEFYYEYINKLPQPTGIIGLIGDSYSLAEAMMHNYVDKQIGYQGYMVDRWSYHRFIPDILSRRNQNNVSQLLINEIYKHNYGVFTSLEIKKLNNYISRGYDGLIFLAPLECNPNDALRISMETVQSSTNIPILTLLFDEHTSNLGVNTRLEAFLDLLNRRNSSLNVRVNSSLLL